MMEPGLLLKFLQAANMKFETFKTILESDDLIYIDSGSIEPDLSINIGDGFSELEYIFGTGSINERLEISEPNLLWDCSCAFSDKVECSIHSNDVGKEIAKRFGQDCVKISYRGVDVIWRDSRYFWPPSVDTIYMIENLLDEGVHDESIQSICEVGCGTSMMGLVLLSINRNVNELYVSDWLITPLLFSRISWEMNKERINNLRGTEPAVTPVLGYGSYWVEHPPPNKLSIDQVYCNPPYLPDLGVFDSVREQNTVGGTALLELLIEKGEEFADEVFINFSEIALPEAKEAENKSSASLEPIGTTHTVPFRVPTALNSPEYMNHLIYNRNLKKHEDSPYPLWHDITTYKLNFA